MNSTSLSLIQRISAGGDSIAWNRFIALYTPILFHWCERLKLTPADTADFVQEVFVILIDQMPKWKYDASRSFRAWLKTILLNVWRKHLRKNRRWQSMDPETERYLEDSFSEMLDHAEHQAFIIRRALQIAQQDFEPTTWQACWQVVFEGHRAEAVAEQLGISVNSVYLAKSRVLRHLRAELSGLVEDLNEI